MAYVTATELDFVSLPGALELVLLLVDDPQLQDVSDLQHLAQGARVTAVLATEVIEPSERRLLLFLAPLVLAVGVISSAFLANSLVDRETIPTAYWDKLLTIAGVAALPIVAMAVLIVRGAIESEKQVSRWQGGIILLAIVAFAFSIGVILICLFQIVVAADAAPNTTPAAPDDWVIWLATLGTGVTLSAIAVAVAAAALDKID